MRPIRVGLSSMLFGVLMIGAVIGMWGRHAAKKRVQEKMAAPAVGLGAHVWWDGDVAYVTLPYDITDEQLLKATTALEGFSKLYLHLPSPNITTSGLMALAEMSNLWGLQMSDITDDELIVIGSMIRLVELNLEASQITNDGLSQLVRLNKLQHLNLDITEISDAGLHHLSCLRELRELSVRRTQVTEKGIKELQMSLPHLIAITESDGYQ